MAEADQHDAERTEDPTQKRLDDALARGDVVKSQEVSTWFVIGGGALMLVGRAVGVAISLFQALTQIQEMTLVFAPDPVPVTVVDSRLATSPSTGASTGRNSV